MQKDYRVKEVLYSSEELEKVILKCSEWVNKTYENSKDLVLVALLKGCIPFLAQLIKNIHVDHTIDFFTVSSYFGGSSSTGSVKIITDLAYDVVGKDVLIIEDIVDSGITIEKIKEILKSRKPKSIKILTLLDKPMNRVNDLVVDYYGISVPNKFLVGFGLDYKEKMRNLPYVGVFDEKYLEKE